MIVIMPSFGKGFLALLDYQLGVRIETAPRTGKLHARELRKGSENSLPAAFSKCPEKTLDDSCGSGRLGAVALLPRQPRQASHFQHKALWG